jgi:5-methylthioadenosine/S-adenosylhomocysteine deaminase
VLTPGLVNAHTHLDLTALRGVIDAPGFFDWIRALTQARGELSADESEDAARHGIAEGLIAGITTYADTAPSDAAFRAMLAMRVRGIAYHEVFGPDPEAAQGALAALEGQVAAMRQRATALVRVGVSPHAPFSVSDALFRAVAAYAVRESLSVAVHIAESSAESAYVATGAGPFAEHLRGRGIAVAPRAVDPISLLDAVGLLRAGTLCIHAVQVDATAVQQIARSRSGVAHCPASNAWLQHGTAPLLEFLEARVRVGLGSDSMASNDQMDILHEAVLAADAQRSRSDQRAPSVASAPIAAEALLRLATLGGAEALGLEGEIGSLEAGKEADLVAFAMPSGAVTSPAAALLAGPRTVRHVVVGGEERVRDGRVLGLDPALADRVARVTARLMKWRAAHPRG